MTDPKMKIPTKKPAKKTRGGVAGTITYSISRKDIEGKEKEEIKKTIYAYFGPVLSRIFMDCLLQRTEYENEQKIILPH